MVHDPRVEAALAFAGAFVALALARRMAIRWYARRAPELLAWSVGMIAFAVGSAALGWGTAAGWDSRLFRVYYLFGGLLTPPLLAVGSLLLKGRRWAIPVAYVYTGLAVGTAVSVPIVGHISGKAIPDAHDHLHFLPARLAAVVGNSAGTLVVIAAALLTFRWRPLGNLLIVAGMVVASVGSALSGVGLATAVAATSILLYAGFAARPSRTIPIIHPARTGEE